MALEFVGVVGLIEPHQVSPGMTARLDRCIYTNMKRQRYNEPYLESVRKERHVCFAEQLRAATRTITKLYNEHLRGTDIGIAQLSLLIRLYFVEDIEISRLARLLETDRTTLARNVQLLERSGHLEVVGSEDLRKRHVRLTDKGFASLEAALPR